MRIALALLLLAGCSKSPAQKFVGKWKQNAGPMRLDVRPDGILTLSRPPQSLPARYRFVDDTTLELTPAAGTPDLYTYEYKNDGEIIVIITPAEAWEFKRTD